MFPKLMKLALISFPVVALYSLTPAASATRRWVPETASPVGS